MAEVRVNLVRSIDGIVVRKFVWHWSIYTRALMSNSVPDEPVLSEATGTFQYQELIESRLGQPISAEILAAEAARVALSPGSKLASARNTLGWTVEQVAAQLKLAPRQIIALEADDYVSLPEPAVVRGFIRAYAKLLKLDATPLVALIAVDGREAKLEQQGNPGSSGFFSSLKLSIFGVALLLLALLIFVFKRI
jgi:transcriptional regulator with XRE-family HTH domain